MCVCARGFPALVVAKPSDRAALDSAAAYRSERLFDQKNLPRSRHPGAVAGLSFLAAMIATTSARPRVHACARPPVRGYRKAQYPGFATAISCRRYYEPRNGQFINRDLIEESGGNNLYGFVLNNPINAWDYTGGISSSLLKQQEAIQMEPFRAEGDRYRGYWTVGETVSRLRQSGASEYSWDRQRELQVLYSPFQGTINVTGSRAGLGLDPRMEEQDGSDYAEMP